MHSPKRNSALFTQGRSFMTQEQMSEYLRNLRNNRPTRPSVTPGADPGASVSSFKSSTESGTYRPSSFGVHRQSLDRTSSSRSSERQSSSSYTERDRRQKELSEARSLRMALDRAGLEERDHEDHRVYAAAQKEASDLIRRHRSPHAPYSATAPSWESTNGETTLKNHTNLSIGSLRSQNSDLGPHNSAPLDSENISPDLPNIKKRSSYSKLANYWNNTGLGQRRRSSGSRRSISGKNKGVFANPEDKIYEDPTDRVAPVPKTEPPLRHQPSASQSSIARKNPFARPYSVKDRSRTNDHISSHQPQAHQNSHSQDNGMVNHGSEYYDESDPIARESIQYKNGVEIRSDEMRAATSARRKDRSPKLPSPSAVSDRPERPIVSFKPDWVPEEEEEQSTRQISQQSSSSPPPAPSAPAHDPSISEFTFPPPKSASRARSSQFQVTPATIHEYVDHNQFQESSVPSITIEDGTSSSSKAVGPSPDDNHVGPDIIVTTESTETLDQKRRRPDKKPSKYRYSAFPPPQSLPTHVEADLNNSRPHLTPTRRTTALCAQCALPISGRIVSAAGLRFHPNCFTCYHCGEGLECIDFYPEPAENRSARLDRIQRRIDGEVIDDLPGATEADDGDDSLRFYCHLDFHELFSPRCKSCKTPIEGEVVVACGAEWHVGHFFCAQCGDPFDQSTPFVEKDGYAWCVECHTHRYSAKCRKCRRPVTNTVIQALGSEWHSECFCCTQCGDEFEGGRFFLRSGTQDPVCLGCEQKRLKA